MRASKGALVLALLGAVAAVLFLMKQAPKSAVPEAPRDTGPAHWVPPRHASCMTGTERSEVSSLMSRYLDLQSERAAKNRIDLMMFLKKIRDRGCEPLADIDGVLETIYTARPFDPPFERKFIPREDPKGKGPKVEIDLHLDSATGIMSVVWDRVRCAFSLPASYPKDPEAVRTHAPYPMIVTLHEPADFVDKSRPGEEVIRRRYPRAANAALLDGCIVYAPVAPNGKFSSGGKIDTERVNLSDMWKRYHVDFDRIVIDGGSDALLFAAGSAVFYAGVIVRGDTADVDPALVQNFAHLPVYIVGTRESA